MKIFMLVFLLVGCAGQDGHEESSPVETAFRDYSIIVEGCEPGLIRCEGLSMDVCTPDGLSWVQMQVCPLTCESEGTVTCE